jgi:hypothetical protein
MRLIFEEDIEHEDFMEVILNGRDYDALEEHGVTMEFPFGLHGKRLLNLHIRMEKGAIMPLIGGKAAKSKAGFSENIKREMEAGKPQKQAVAIAYSQARKGKKRAKKK